MSELAVVSRQILVFNQPRQKYVNFDFPGNSWKELASLIEKTPELEARDISKYNAVLASSKLTLEFPNAEIPEGYQKIFLYEAKVKSGAKSSKPVDAFANYTYNELRKLIKEKNLGTGLSSSPTRQALIDVLERNAGITTSTSSTTTPSGKTKTVVTKTTSPETTSVVEENKQIIEKDKAISIEERVSSLEITFVNLIKGLHALTKGYVEEEPVVEVKKETVKETVNLNISLSDLEREANELLNN